MFFLIREVNTSDLKVTVLSRIHKLSTSLQSNNLISREKYIINKLNLLGLNAKRLVNCLLRRYDVGNTSREICLYTEKIALRSREESHSIRGPVLFQNKLCPPLKEF